MLDPRNDITTARENSTYSLFDETSSRLFEDYAQQLGSERTQDAPSQSATPSSDTTPFVPPIPGTSDAATPSTSDSGRFVPPTPGTSDPDGWQLSRDSRQSGGNIKPNQYLDVDASTIYKKPSSEASIQARAAEIKKLIQNDPELKDAYLEKLKALQKGSQKLTDADYLKMKEGAKKLAASEKSAPEFNAKDLRDIPEKQEIDKNLGRNKIKKDAIGSGPVEDKTMQQKPLKKPIDPKQEMLENRKKEKMEGVDSGPIEDRTGELKPHEPPQINGEDEAIREFEMNLPPSTAPDATPDEESFFPESMDETDGVDEESESLISFDTAEGVAPPDEPAAAMENINASAGLGSKSEPLDAVRNDQKCFTASTRDGTTFVQRPDGTCIVSSAEGRTKVSTDGTVTVTVGGVEQQFHFDNASRKQVHPDGSTTYHFREGTSVTELSRGGEASGLVIRQPNGTAIETNYARPTELRYAPQSRK